MTTKTTTPTTIAPRPLARPYKFEVGARYLIHHPHLGWAVGDTVNVEAVQGSELELNAGLAVDVRFADSDVGDGVQLWLGVGAHHKIDYAALLELHLPLVWE